jgi:hypothetical protein
MAVTSLRVDTRFSSGKWVLLAAGASSIVVGSVGVVVGRSSTVCGVFVVVGLALLGASAVATYGHEQALPIVAGLVGPAPSDVVIDDDRVVAVRSDEASRRLAQQDRDTHRAHTQLASATYLALLVVVAIVLALGATLAVVVVALVLLGGL